MFDFEGIFVLGLHVGSLLFLGMEAVVVNTASLHKKIKRIRMYFVVPYVIRDECKTS